MPLGQALSYFRTILKKAGITSWQIDAMILISHALSISREQLIFDSQYITSASQLNKIRELISRRCNYEPISHILGRREFFGYDFLVNKNVLDPRPDSEVIINAICQIIPERNKIFSILELGIGSGCLLLTMLKIFPNAQGLGIDKEQSALQVAMCNAISLEVNERLDLRQSDWFSAIDQQNKFDVIISNPPYIKTADINFLQPEIRNYEPLSALDGGDDGLDCYRAIAAKVNDFLKPQAYLLLEIGYGQKKAVVEIVNSDKMHFIASKADLAGIDRILIFQRNADI